MSKVRCNLKDPFPTELLATLDLGNVDGHRDSLIERGFIATRSIKSFLNDNHSIIIGAFGTGKSAIFNLMRNKSQILEVYKNDLIVTIDEQIQFEQLKEDSKKYFPNLSQKLTFQLLWKFQICRRISEEISNLENFPSNECENYLSEFLSRTGGRGGHLSILSRIKDLFEKVSFKIKAKLSDIPVDVELSKEAAKTVKQIELNLDKVIENVSKAIKERDIRQSTVIIDKLDKFVAGEEYETQRAYIEALLELEDDLYSEPKIGFKVFLRSDLYDRLDFSSLGPDKAEDNTLRLVWNREEIRAFVARRMYLALEGSGIWHMKNILESSDMSEYRLRWYEKVLLEEKKTGIKYKCAHYYNKLFGRKRSKRTLFEKLDLLIINKLFNSNLLHECPEGNEEHILNYDFFDTHFLDGNNSCTPRYMLVFLKELLDEANEFYFNSPHIHITPELESDDWVYNLFDSHLVYKAYIQSKEKFIRHVSKVDDNWTSHIMELLEKKGGKQTFDYKWVKKNIQFTDSEDDQALVFLIYLQVIGFCKPVKYDRDIKKRNFELPILYKTTKSMA
ncbi:MAG: P-loop ATPase, Sll1717 family [Pseudoalteromonas distincta]|uniref:P-loop ATPase, Sll1717 family n=1 Tax=Pseudoalteromonas distincta TaxID=77608 RepID=UPI003F95B8B4